MKECEEQDKTFVDEEFKHEYKSISSNNEFQSKFQKAQWLRPMDIFQCNENEVVLFDSIEPGDIKQGGLGVCYFLSTLSALGEFPERVVKIFNSRAANKYGLYSVTFYKLGEPFEVIVDDYFPCLRSKPFPLFVRPNGREIWVMILEKAWAKFFGNYMLCEAMVNYF